MLYRKGRYNGRVADTSDDETLEQLRRRYLVLTRRDLPERARAEGWTLKFDHCFMRVILDHLFQDAWYNHLTRKEAAYRQLDGEQLGRAVKVAEHILEEGDTTLRMLNQQSLAWRGKT